MWLTRYYSEDHEGVRFTRNQGSDFAKQVAEDFNPIHDRDAKLFCVPGDLLFAYILARYGLSPQMRFTFTGMVGAGVLLRFPVSFPAEFTVEDTDGKRYLNIQRQPEVSNDQRLVEALTRSYVRFSGQNFPGILVPLMAEHGVMINPDRPLVIYESMEFDLRQLDFETPKLELVDTAMQVKGKKGNVRLDFQVLSSGDVIGHGTKYMVLRGLQAYEQNRIERLVDNYLSNKRAYGSKEANG